MASNNGNGNGKTDLIPEISESRCNICTSISRQSVDKLHVAGFNPSDIARELIARDDDFKNKSLDTVRKNVERHIKRHVNIRDQAVRKIMERRAIEQGILLDEYEGQLLTGRALLDLFIQKAHEQIVDPESRIKYDTALEAVRMLEDFEKNAFTEQMEVMKRQVWAISQAVKELVPERLYEPIGNRARELFEHPELELAIPRTTVKKELND